MVPENEFEDSEDEEMNSANGVQYAKSVRHGRVSKSSEAGDSMRQQQPRPRGTVDTLPAAATKLKFSHDSLSGTESSSNGAHLNGSSAATTKSDSDSAGPLNETKIEKDGVPHR